MTIPAASLSCGELDIQWSCGGTTSQAEIGQIVLYDPSGHITDAATGKPISGATVTLYKVPGWTAKTSADDTAAYTCESNASKPAGQPWSQAAPTSEGVVANPASGEIGPAANPQITNASGYYGWDVAAGCWYLTVEAAGYDTKVSPVVGVPTAVTDLDLALTPQATPAPTIQARVTGYPAHENGPHQANAARHPQ